MWNAASGAGRTPTSVRRSVRRSAGACAGACAIACAILAAIVGCGPAETGPTALEIASSPPGAEVFVGGESVGVTPARIEPAAPGVRIVELRLPGFIPVSAPVRVVEAQTASVDETLEPVEGLVLFETRPPGADVTIDGVYRGKTPLCAVDLPPGVRRVRLEKPHHDAREIEVEIADRTPQRHQVDLVSHLATLQVNSTPEGAEILLDGKPIGTTPVHLNAVPEGAHLLAARGDGYLEQEREIQLKAGVDEVVEFALRESPGDLRVESVPSGAAVRIEGLGEKTTPCDFTGLDPGSYTVRVSAEGFADATVDAAVGGGRTATVHVDLERTSGAVQIATLPGDVQVFIDGTPRGVTPVADGVVSEPIVIEYVPQGGHVIALVREGYHSRSRPVRVEVGKTVVIEETLKKRWIPDAEVVVEGNVHYRGVILEESPDGVLLMEVAPGVRKRIEPDRILSRGPYRPDAGP